MKDRNGERRHQCALRELVDRECEGVMPHIADRIRRVARKAYYLGVGDGFTTTGAMVCDNSRVLQKEADNV